MKRILLTLGLVILCIGFLNKPVFANGEHIKNFDSNITLGTDNTIAVTENITYDSAGLEKHGIFRNIRLLSSDNKKVYVTDISVTDQGGTLYNTSISQINDTLSIKIGDPNVTFSGEKTYRISYTAHNIVAHANDALDELYWNITGNEWPFPIDHISVHLVLPNGANIVQQACYLGPQGSTERCDSTTKDGNFSSARTLNPGEGLTIAIGVPVGIIAPAENQKENPLLKYIHLIEIIFSILLPLIVGITMFSLWNKKGRDPKGTGIIVPQYDVPDELTPLEVAEIVNGKIEDKNISAEIIYLATLGYLKISSKEQKLIGLINVPDYEVTLLKDVENLKNTFDIEILKAIFGTIEVGKSVMMSSLRNHFYLKIPSIQESIRLDVLNKEYYSNLPKKNNAWIVLPTIIVGCFIFLPSILGAVYGIGISISVIVSYIIWAVFNSLMAARTARGVVVREYLLGLKDYLNIAEKNRLAFHNAPEKKPEIFEMLLPYAMIYGVEKSWAQEFEGIYVTPPNWYNGQSGSHFSAVQFGQTMGAFSTFTASSVSSAPSSASGGGGFSGGGGGGGGGGSW